MSIFPEALLANVAAIIALAQERNITITTAESCTGGLIAALFTEMPGASHVFQRGIVSYANTAKIDLLEVDAAELQTHGAVSAPTARAMAEGARRLAQADFAVAVTGIAGPSGGTIDKPVGLVHIAVASKNHVTQHEAYQFAGNRSEIRLAAVAAALRMLNSTISLAEPGAES